jgi:uncharacterized protein YbaP (TraB family)
MRKNLGAAIALATGLAAAPAMAEPAMWTVRDADTTVTLFGTIHMLEPGVDWQPPGLAGAMARADALWLEIDILEDMSATLAVITGGTSPKRPLKARLSPEDYALVEKAAASVAMPMSKIENLRPWLAAVTLSIEALRRAGFDETGVDLRLALEARDRGVPVHGFETGAEQIKFFSGLGEEEETALLLETVRTAGFELDLFQRMFDAWEDGDEAALEELLVQSVLVADPDLADALLTRRNRSWAEKFDAIMAEPGERVVAVGAGHLVGADSLPALLAAKGWTVEPIHGPEPAGPAGQ